MSIDAADPIMFYRDDPGATAPAVDERPVEARYREWMAAPHAAGLRGYDDPRYPAVREAVTRQFVAFADEMAGELTSLRALASAPPAPAPAGEDAGGLEAESGFRQTYADAVARGKAMEAAGEGDAALRSERSDEPIPLALDVAIGRYRSACWTQRDTTDARAALNRALAAALTGARAGRERLDWLAANPKRIQYWFDKGWLAYVPDERVSTGLRADGRFYPNPSDAIDAARRAGAAGGEASHE